MSTRIVLADDQTLVRAGFRALLERADDLLVVGEAANGAEAVELARAEHPDVILMDIRMPVMDGIEATRTIVGDAALQSTRIVVLTTFEVDDYVFDALRAGASGFLLKDIDPDDLRRAVRLVARGESLLSPSITRRLIETFVSGDPTVRLDDKPLGVLTEREREIVGLVGEGLSNEEIAQRVFVSPATVKTHVGRALLKLRARDRAQLVVIAYETGLVVPGSR
ncbi:response regulator [Sinosporangium siamense]|uniref:DNA-binding response regulator n=1 Tax=Sinosporangium siamense TaxID=1367973 RepID=A0A919RN62_9ACTN|nr:response regulator transcription factor [Sinosporangium siamense]GII95064.1 DNA-binding response regulator [Sinosporangium siamense]